MTLLIGLTGYKGSGKSEVAKYLNTQYNFERSAFAWPLKDMLIALGLSEVHIHGSLKETPNKILSGRTPRFAMQTLGTEWGRDVMHPEFWTNIWKRRAIRALSESKDARLVVEDVRFPNEAAIVEYLGGEVWYINRIPNEVEKDLHPSETLMATIKPYRIIINNADLGVLYENVDASFMYMKEDRKK